jgi:Protein of unknown function (DUF3800)
MYLMYVDESGDTGIKDTPSRFFVLSGMIIHESRWRDMHAHMLQFRRKMKEIYGLPTRTEIHASEYIRRPPHPNIDKFQRLSILRNYLDEISRLDYISITNIVVNKNKKPDDYNVFENAWKVLFQRFENTIKHGNFPGAFSDDKGIIIVDNTDGRKLQNLIRKMAIHNPIPHHPSVGMGIRNMPIERIIEDPHHKNSEKSYFIQTCDVCAYFLHQKFAPCSYIQKKGARHYFDRLKPVLNVKASTSHALGIVII